MKTSAQITGFVALAALTMGVAAVATRSDDVSILGVSDDPLVAEVVVSDPVPRTFTNQEFSEIYNVLPLPNITPIVEPPVITGNEQLDNRIQSIAENRGYRLRHVAATNLSEHHGFLMQELMARDVGSLLSAAEEAGHSLYITHAHRSIEQQRQLFIGRLQAQAVNFDDLANGLNDAAIDSVLRLASPPGYSRHHSGYTVDFADNNAPLFANSSSYRWLSADNFRNAKQYGFIPSYPDNVENQGPNPEEWEYVWIGTNLTFE